jgi:hypothetical protein
VFARIDASKKESFPTLYKSFNSVQIHAFKNTDRTISSCTKKAFTSTTRFKSMRARTSLNSATNFFSLSLSPALTSAVLTVVWLATVFADTGGFCSLVLTILRLYV